MIELTWYKGYFKDGKFFIYESHNKIIDYYDKLDRDETYEIYDMLIDLVREGYFVKINAV